MFSVPKLGLIGDSHAIALLDALGAWRDSGGGNVKPGFGAAFSGYHEDINIGVHRLENRVVGGRHLSVVAAVQSAARKDRRAYWTDKPQNKIGIGPYFAQLCSALSECSTIISVIGGIEIGRFLYFKPEVDYQVAGYGPYRKGVQPVDRSHIAAQAISHLEHGIGPGLLALRQLCPSSTIIHIAPPPPIRDLEMVVNLEGIAITQTEAIDPILRRLWYDAQVEALNELFSSFCHVMVPPRETMDEDGFIRPELIEGLSHGNAQYGRIIWKQLLSRMEAGAW